MLKRIILLSDGTGNAASKVWKSNVWRIFESLDLRGDEQVAFYDDGVGTSSFKPLAILGGVFGWGLKRNVLDLYTFLCANYKPGVDIYAFGFSRGAFTIRVLIGLVLNQGLVKGETRDEIYSNAKMAYRAYRAEKFHTFIGIETPFRKFRDLFLYVFGRRYDRKDNHQVASIKFIGLWDTVAAYGLPIDEMSRGVSQYIWPLELPNRDFEHSKIERACHALSLDDERTTFHPVLWNEKDVPSGKLQQVWFSGVHSNVGGGYPDNSLAYIPLYWIMKEAEANGLVFKVVDKNKPTNPDPDMVVYAEWHRDKDGRLYNSRNGLGGYYRYGPRKIADLSKAIFSGRKGDRVDNGPPTIHETAILRAQKGAHRYSPIGIPREFNVLTESGIKPQAAVESDDDAKKRCDKQEEIWNYVWRRRILYFTTIFATFYLFIYPLTRKIPIASEFSTGLSLVSAAVRSVGSILPGALTLWIDAYARDPSHLLVLGSFVILLMLLGVFLGAKISDRMERVWRSSEAAPLSKLEIVLVTVGALAAFYVLASPYLPDSVQLPSGGKQFLAEHVDGSVTAIIIAIVIAILTPPWVVYHLRTWKGYRIIVKGIKQFLLPFLFAASFLLTGALFASHLAFSVQEANGMVCKQTDRITNAIKNDELGEQGEVQNQGLQACRAAGIASCSPKDTRPTCTNAREPFCVEGTAVCETRMKTNCDKTRADCYYRVPICKVQKPAGGDRPEFVHDAGLAICAAICETQPRATIRRTFKTSELCHATGIWLEEGQKYRVRLTVPSSKDEKNAWRDDDGSVVSTRGRESSDLLSNLREVMLWPLKRHLFEERFKVIARVGPIGSDERVLEPDDPRSDNLDVVITPKRAGELFLYVNEAVGGWPALYRYFYNKNNGTGKLEVTRAPQPN